MDAQRIAEQKIKSNVLSEKESLEMDEKRKRRENGAEAYSGWEKKRKIAIQKRKAANKEMEAVFTSNQKGEKFSNTWEKVLSLVDIKESDYKGSKSIVRMRQTLINRKKDFEKK